MIPRVTRIQKIIEANRRIVFVHLGMHGIFGSRKYMPHRTEVSRFARSLSHHHCTVWSSALSLCSVTAHAHWKSRVRSNNTPARKVYVTLVIVYLLLFAVELLCCDAVVQLIWTTLVKISFTDLLPAMVCSNSLIIHVYLMFLYTES